MRQAAAGAVLTATTRPAADTSGWRPGSVWAGPIVARGILNIAWSIARRHHRREWDFFSEAGGERFSARPTRLSAGFGRPNALQDYGRLGRLGRGRGRIRAGAVAVLYRPPSPGACLTAICQGLQRTPDPWLTARRSRVVLEKAPLGTRLDSGRDESKQRKWGAIFQRAPDFSGSIHFYLGQGRDGPRI